jgi:hypothetical protein
MAVRQGGRDLDEADWRAYHTRNKPGPKLSLSSLNLPPALVNAMKLKAQRNRERPRSNMKTLEEFWGSDDE